MSNEFVILKPEEKILGLRPQRSGWSAAVFDGQRVFVPLNGRKPSYIGSARTLVAAMSIAKNRAGHVKKAERDGIAGFYAWLDPE